MDNIGAFAPRADFADGYHSVADTFLFVGRRRLPNRSSEMAKRDRFVDQFHVFMAHRPQVGGTMRQSTETPERGLSLTATLIALLLGICGANVAMCHAQRHETSLWWVEVRTATEPEATLALNPHDLQARFPDIFALDEADTIAPHAPCILPSRDMAFRALVLAYPPAAERTLLSVPCGTGSASPATVTIAAELDPESSSSPVRREALVGVLAIPDCEGKRNQLVTPPPSHWDVDAARIGFVYRADGSRACQRMANLRWCQQRNALCVDSCVVSSACGARPEAFSTHCARVLPPTVTR